MTHSRLAYVNGEFLAESQATVSVRDKGLVYGDCVFDTARTFGGKLFRLDAHLDRLYRNLELARIEPGIKQAELAEITMELVERNLAYLRAGEDYWVTQRITAGQQQLDGEVSERSGPTVIVDCIPLPLRARAKYFANGIETVLADRPRVSPDALSANIKSNNYLNMMLAQREVQAEHPNAWALMCDENGNLAEGAGCNFFIVRDGVVKTPSAKYVLDGVSRQVVIEICQNSSVPFEECTLSMEDTLEADESFFTSTSLCICPVRSINGKQPGRIIPGPVTQLITDVFKQNVGFDFV